MGTPKTLDQAIKHALCIGPMNKIEDNAYFIIKDFLSQRFGAAMLKAGPEEEKMLENLFKEITKRV